MVKTCAKLKKGQIESHPWPKNLSAAAFTYAFSTGVHLSTAAHPIVVRLITAIIRAMCPDMHFSSFILERIVLLHMHRDLHSDPSYNNVSISCSRWHEWMSLDSEAPCYV